MLRNLILESSSSTLTLTRQLIIVIFTGFRLREAMLNIDVVVPVTPASRQVDDKPDQTFNLYATE